VRQTGEEDVDACSWKYKLIPKSLLVGHDKFVLREALSDRFADFLEEVSLALDRDTATIAELRTFGDEVVQIHHVKLCVVDDLLEVFALFDGDIVIQGVLTRLACQGPQTYAKTVSLRAKTNEVVLRICKGQRIDRLEEEIDRQNACLWPPSRHDHLME
jgi:hypothetical protein